MSTRRSRHAGRAFTLIEIMVVISIILVLASLVLGVGSALLRRAERSQVESAMTIMESAFTEWEGQTGRPVTYNGAFNSLTAPTTEIYPSGATLEVFDIREPGTPPAPNSTGNRLIYTRARGAGVFTVNLLAQLESIRPMLAGIPPSMLRAEANTSSYPATNILSGTPSVFPIRTELCELLLRIFLGSAPIAVYVWCQLVPTVSLECPANPPRIPPLSRTPPLPTTSTCTSWIPQTDAHAQRPHFILRTTARPSTRLHAP